MDTNNTNIFNESLKNLRENLKKLRRETKEGFNPDFDSDTTLTRSEIQDEITILTSCIHRSLRANNSDAKSFKKQLKELRRRYLTSKDAKLEIFSFFRFQITNLIDSISMI